MPVARPAAAAAALRAEVAAELPAALEAAVAVALPAAVAAALPAALEAAVAAALPAALAAALAVAGERVPLRTMPAQAGNVSTGGNACTSGFAQRFAEKQAAERARGAESVRSQAKLLRW